MLSMRARLGLVQGARVAFGRLSVILGLGARKGGKEKGKGKGNRGCGRNNKYDEKNTQKQNNKVVFCLQIAIVNIMSLCSRHLL